MSEYYKSFNINNLVEISLLKSSDFLKIKETLTRIGINNEGIIEQICYILFKQNRYFIVHIKELMLMDGDELDIEEYDISIRNLIINLLSDWSLIKILNMSMVKFPVASLRSIKIIPFKSKDQWILKSNYNIGKRTI